MDARAEKKVIERVARALCNKIGPYLWENDFDADADANGNFTKDDYRELARVAIRAVYDDRMIVATE